MAEHRIPKSKLQILEKKKLVVWYEATLYVKDKYDNVQRQK